MSYYPDLSQMLSRFFKAHFIKILLQFYKEKMWIIEMKSRYSGVRKKHKDALIHFRVFFQGLRTYLLKGATFIDS